ncbi:MAG: aminoglycoside phosphotransferase family protein [Clostridiales bacterium]|nr:aminoglycoside phosphotransferase family protein [Clostridiales bacterium]
MTEKIELKKVTDNFCFDGTLIHVEPYGHGHINDTYAVYFKRLTTPPIRYILQKINHSVFKEPERLMQNIDKVTGHIRRKIEAEKKDATRGVLTIIRTVDDSIFYRDGEGNYWRAYHFIENAIAYQQVEKPEHFYEAARAFGLFQQQLSDFPADTLHETIPDFHNTEKRFEALLSAIDLDSAGRVKFVEKEIEFALNRKKDTAVLTTLLQEGKLPLRVTHNDTKLNNVMIDNKTGTGICVIDLDTVMPGLALYDFGDSIRSGAGTAPEDELNLEAVSLNLGLFELYTKGFLETAGADLTPLEKEYLPFSAKLMTLECGIRFLTDYLSGDTYFKIHRKSHNLERCRTQFALVADMERKMDQMTEIVKKYS